MKKFLIILIWFFSLIIAIIFAYENPEKLDIVKYYFKSHLPSKIKFEQGPSQRSIGNSFAVEFSKEVSFSEKTAFVVHDENISNFDKNSLKIYFQNGYLLKSGEVKKLNLPSTLTRAKNGGIKTVLIPSDNKKDLVEIPEVIRKSINIIPVNTVDEVLKHALTKTLKPVEWAEIEQASSKGEATSRH